MYQMKSTDFETFEDMLNAYDNGKYKPIYLHSELIGKKVIFPMYQLLVHIEQVRLMSMGVRFKGIYLRDFRKYYQLTNRDTRRCHEELKELFKLLEPLYV